MKDTYGREIDYIRISVTDRCNLRCRYCMPEEGVESISHDRILRFAEIVRIAEAAAALGISKIKLTGGEPLVRRGIVSLVRELKQVPGIREITMTTNGVLLGEMYEDLLEAGLTAVTISLDTLDPKEYARMTRRDEFARVMASLEKAVKDGRIPVKINCVSYRREDPQELRNIALLAKEYPVHVRFIEMMPIGLGKQFAWLSQEELMEILRPATGVLIPVEEVLGNGPARYFRAEGFAGRVGFISAISHRFCDGCNRIRITSEGYLKSCLQYETGIDLREALAAEDPQRLKEAMAEGIRRKPHQHHFTEQGEIPQEERHKMSQIGG